MLLVLIGTARLLKIHKNVGFRSTCLAIKSENRAYNPSFPVLGGVFSVFALRLSAALVVSDRYVTITISNQ